MRAFEVRKPSEGGILGQKYGGSEVSPRSQQPNRNRNVQFSQTNRFADDDVDLSWVHRFMRPVPEAVLKTWKMSKKTNHKGDAELLQEILEDLGKFDGDRYRSELLRIRERNRQNKGFRINHLTQAPGQKKELQEYQSKKRLATMSLLKNKVPVINVEDRFLSGDEVYNRAKVLYKQRIVMQTARR